MASEAIFFTSPAELRAWFEAHYADTQELLIGFHKKATNRPTLTYAQALDEVLCYGWIDGVRKGIGNDSYTIRYTPRKPKSNWSAVNVKRANELIELGLMKPSGLREFKKRDQEKTDQYSYERQASQLDPARDAAFKNHAAAWEFFQAQAPSYQKACIWWIVSAKQEATKDSRLAKLIDHSADKQRIPALVSPSKRKKSTD